MTKPIKTLELQGLSLNRNSKFYQFKSDMFKASEDIAPQSRESF